MDYDRANDYQVSGKNNIGIGRVLYYYYYENGLAYWQYNYIILKKIKQTNKNSQFNVGRVKYYCVFRYGVRVILHLRQ